MAICKICKTDQMSFRNVSTNKGMKEMCENCYKKMVNDFWSDALKAEQNYHLKKRSR